MHSLKIHILHKVSIWAEKAIDFSGFFQLNGHIRKKKPGLSMQDLSPASKIKEERK